MALFERKPVVTENAVPATNAVVSDADKAAIAAKNAARLAAKKAALGVLVNYCKANAVADGDVQAALKVLQPQRVRDSGVVKISANDRVKGYFAGGKSISGMDLYKKAHMGISDMRRSVVLALKTAAPEERQWIEYDGQADEWTIKGTGPTPPEGWLGFVPA